MKSSRTQGRELREAPAHATRALWCFSLAPDRPIHPSSFRLHPSFEAKADEVGQECYLLIPGVSKPGKYRNANEFLTEKLLAP